MNNGWYSVTEDVKPESGEEVLTLAYAGDSPPPEDMFADPELRVYEICTYFYPGDLAEQEAPPRVGQTLEECMVPVTIGEEGFYVYEPGDDRLMAWRRLSTIKEHHIGIICWKSLDWPSP